MMNNLAVCVSCQRTLNRSNNRRRISMPLTLDLVQARPYLITYLLEVRNITEFGGIDRICRPCIQRAARYNSTRNNVVQENDMPVDPHIEIAEEPAVRAERGVTFPGFTRAPRNTRHCIIAMCENQNLHRIDRRLRTSILKDKKFYIPLGVHVCEEHNSDYVWNDIEQNTRHVYRTFSTKQLMDMVRILHSHKSHLNFEHLTSISDSVFHYYIGFSKREFQEIIRCTPSITRNHPRRPATALATVLIKLHTGDSNQRLSSLLKMSRPVLERTMSSVRASLCQEFLPRHLGYDHITREDVLTRCLAIPNALFGNNHERAVTIHDGTYMYLQRSSNYYFQRKSYSLHKWRNLYKPYLIVCPDGHILDIIGPYSATTSDAIILNNILTSRTDPFHWFFNPNDVLILDRGFRDSREVIESCGYIAKMPITKPYNTTQLSTQQANESRKVTMCRWVVETVNGRLKNQFKQLRHINNNRAMTHLFDEIRIAGALLNAFGKPLTDHRLVSIILNEISQRSDLENHLSIYIIAKNMNARRALFRTITAENEELNSFPVLNTDDLVIFALGTYQIKQARSYYGEHIKRNGQYIIEICREMEIDDIRQYEINVTVPVLIRGRIQSRHRQARTYYVYIVYEGNTEVAQLSGRQAIIGHYCSCVVGKRTLGSCSHIMAIIWYLGWARHQNDLCPPALFLDNIIIRHDVENEAFDEPSDNDDT